MKALVVLGMGVLLFSSCRVEYPADATFACNATLDCGGDGFVCVTEGRLRGICCQAAEEVCDGRDNDCNGLVDDLAAVSCYDGPLETKGRGICRAGVQQCLDGVLGACEVQVTPVAERCNGRDDDCDGLTDEDFTLANDSQNCGRCGKACDADSKCENSVCTNAIEANCGDGLDDEGDALIDCADGDCEGKSCGPDCVCRAQARGEGLCGDGVDNDSDGAVDCVDSDCQGATCGAGCTCIASLKKEANCGDTIDNDGDGLKDCADLDCATASCGPGCECRSGKKSETNCRDATDNDADGKFDCIDSDCVAQACKPTPYTFVCNSASQCTCNGSVSLPVEFAAQCQDGVDNDCNGKKDCEEVSCNNQACGSGCVCLRGARSESKCNDFVDNDGDGKTDCADAVDCPVNSACRYLLGQTEFDGTCRSDSTCQ